MSVTPSSPQDLRERARALCQGFEPPPRTELPRFDRCEAVHVLLNGDEVVDGFERGLAKGARIRGALDLAIAEGLASLTVGSRLLDLGYHLDDYAREVLDLRPRTTLELVQLARELRTRPLLRESLREARRLGVSYVKLRALAHLPEAEITFWCAILAPARPGSAPSDPWARCPGPRARRLRKEWAR